MSQLQSSPAGLQPCSASLNAITNSSPGVKFGWPMVSPLSSTSSVVSAVKTGWWRRPPVVSAATTVAARMLMNESLERFMMESLPNDVRFCDGCRNKEGTV